MNAPRGPRRQEQSVVEDGELVVRVHSNATFPRQGHRGEDSRVVRFQKFPRPDRNLYRRQKRQGRDVLSGPPHELGLLSLCVESSAALRVWTGQEA